jgi:hypothetical protein
MRAGMGNEMEVDAFRECPPARSQEQELHSMFCSESRGDFAEIPFRDFAFVSAGSVDVAIIQLLQALVDFFSQM